MEGKIYSPVGNLAERAKKSRTDHFIFAMFFVSAVTYL